ncbi:MAG: penicillin acylase family protein [Gemmataceae bacterium]
MPLPRLLLRLLGRRLPTVRGELAVPGLAAPITVRRDQWGIPHVAAESPADAWFGLGFCHAQDRGFQLETLLRVARGTLAELVGPDGLPVDRMSRRIGFRRAADAQLPAQHADIRATLAAYTAGVNAGFARGGPKAHEFVLLGGEPTPWEPADVLAVLNLQACGLASNWDLELARLRILLADGPDALRALDPLGSAAELTGQAAPGADLTPALDRLAEDLGRFREYSPAGGGSNNWAIAGARTASGKPLLANDPHLPPAAPGIWYLAHLTTPDWSVAGGGLVGGPALPVAHNGHACWGMTAGLTDNTDLFVETLGPDGRSVREADGSFRACDVHREVIRVKGGADHVEEVLVTPRGPVISPLVAGLTHAVSLRAVWLMPLPIRGVLDAPAARGFDPFRRGFAHWPTLPQNVLYADADGTIGYQLVGQLPVRRLGHGLFPAPADTPGGGWADELVPFDRMPHATDPPAGFLATANDPPPNPPGGPFLGLDFCDPSRAATIREELAKKDSGWTVADCQGVQTNVRSRRWQDFRAYLLSLTPDDPDAAAGLDLLRGWDGEVSAESAAATVFELWVAELGVRAARAKAPRSWEVALGGAGGGPLGHNLFSERRTLHLAHLLRTEPPGWFPRPWADEAADALAAVVRHLRQRVGPGPAWWAWGAVRALEPRHLILGRHRWLGPLFNLPAVSVGGDAHTVLQAGVRPLTPTAPPHMIPGLRAVFDTADWANCRFGLLGGQSGNPLSPHFADLLPLWQDGDGVPIAWTSTAVLRAAVHVLRLVPAAS